MNRIYFLFTTFSLFAVAFSGCVRPDSETSNLINENISATEAYELFQEYLGDADFVLLDVRTDEEYSVEYISGAQNIDFYQDDFRDLLDLLDRENTYLIYCGSGKRGNSALELMKEMSFHEAYNIEGGLAECHDVGFEIVSK